MFKIFLTDNVKLDTVLQKKNMYSTRNSISAGKESWHQDSPQHFEETTPVTWTKKKKKNITDSNIKDICYAIVKELHASGYNLGYRALRQKLVHGYNLKVKSSTVYYILRMRSQDIAYRLARRLKSRENKSQGPKFIWHRQTQTTQTN